MSRPAGGKPTGTTVWYLTCGCVVWSPGQTSGPFSLNLGCRRCGQFASEVAYVQRLEGDMNGLRAWTSSSEGG